uniref:Retrotransposon gag domain-containing protein n=1 Tax=Oryza sativa subsp. japonica TaxID=39947 RepID=Q8S5E4_ORYSJ|nr:Hypothetical protein with similarity to putative retroelements [Oryza sativa Japonica Group]
MAMTTAAAPARRHRRLEAVGGGNATGCRRGRASGGLHAKRRASRGRGDYCEAAGGDGATGRRSGKEGEAAGGGRRHGRERRMAGRGDYLIQGNGTVYTIDSCYKKTGVHKGAPQQKPWADMIADVMREQFGLKPKDSGNLYRHPYLEHFERVPLPNRYKVPDFSKFSGKDNVTTYEHVNRFLAHCGEVSATDALRVRLFPSRSAFTWFSALPYNFVHTWADLERQFHKYFYSGIHQMKLSDLTSIKQKHDESVQDYIQRFRDMRNRCFSFALTDSQLADLAFQGLLAPTREKFATQEFESLAHLAQKVKNVNTYLSEVEEEEDPEVATAEWARNKRVVTCQWVKDSGKEETFDFDITKANKIFDLLLREKQIHLPAGHMIPSAIELGKRKYCKWHSTGSYSTNECKVFRQQIQSAIEQRRIKFDDPKKSMEINGNPFPVNMNGGMRLPSIQNYPGCSGIDEDHVGSSSRFLPRNENRPIQKKLPVHQRLGPLHQDPIWREDEEDESRKQQWCPSGIFTKNHKRRVQRMWSREWFQEVHEEINHRLKRTKQEWRVKSKVVPTDEVEANKARWIAKGKTVESSSVNMVFVLPAEYCAEPTGVEIMEESLPKLVLSPKQVVVEKPEGTEHWHLKPLYVKGFVNGKPMSKILVDGGAAVNLMPYATFRKLGKNAEYLMKTNMVLKDFGGNPTEANGVLKIKITVGSKTVPTTFFVIDGKGSYGLLHGRDWIHANYCIPSTMHQSLIQWQGDQIEVVLADRSVNVANADLTIWEMDVIDCLSRNVWEGGYLKVSDHDIQLIGGEEPQLLLRGHHGGFEILRQEYYR